MILDPSPWRNGVPEEDQPCYNDPRGSDAPAQSTGAQGPTGGDASKKWSTRSAAIHGLNFVFEWAMGNPEGPGFNSDDLR